MQDKLSMWKRDIDQVFEDVDRKWKATVIVIKSLDSALVDGSLTKEEYLELNKYNREHA